MHFIAFICNCKALCNPGLKNFTCFPVKFVFSCCMVFASNQTENNLDLAINSKVWNQMLCLLL